MVSRCCVLKGRLRAIIFFILVVPLVCGFYGIAMCQDNGSPLIDDQFLRKHLPQLKNPRLMTEPDIVDEVEKDNYRKEGWSFALTGDFNEDGWPDYAVVGKYEGPFPDKSVFTAIFTKKKNAIVLKYLRKHGVPADVAFLKKEKTGGLDIREIPAVARKFDAISVAFALYTDYGYLIIWNGKRYAQIDSDL